MQRYAGFTLLIVDDNPHNRFTLRSLIETHMDVTVLEAESGQQAIDLALGERRVDIIILDVQMPEMDGFQTAQMLGIRRKTRDIPIIFLTAAFKSDEFRRRGYELGAVDYLLKPIDDGLLLNKISAYFRLLEKERDLNRRLEEQVAARTAELERARRYQEGIVRTMGEALLVLSPEGRVKSVNPAAAQMLGYTEAQLLGMGIGDLFEEDEAEQAGAFMGAWLEALIRTGVLEAIEARLLDAQGRQVPILFSRRAMRDAAGAITDIICIAKDMTGYEKTPAGDTV